MRNRTILSLCDTTGIWSEPYRAAGYRVIKVDIKDGGDVRTLPYQGKVHGIIMQPPCTHFAGSGARWWKAKGPSALIEGLQVVDACLRAVAICEPEWWVLENPVGRLKNHIGPAVMTFQPHEYAGYADDPEAEAYTKRTCLWGNFLRPEKKDVGNKLGSIMHKMPPSEGRAAKRSKTPQGFARAFFEANR